MKKLSRIKLVPKKIAKYAACACLAMGFAANVNIASAGFLQDFYTSAGANVNVTPAQVYQSQSLNVVTGGGMVWKAPNRTFSPVYFTPPSLSAGCGGIDVFLGAFGLASKEQFIQFLRNVGQNSAGLAFKVALHAMAPDLAQQIQEVATQINKYTSDLTNSCQAAKRIMDSGPGRWINDAVAEAVGKTSQIGQYQDFSLANEAIKNDGAKAVASANRVTDNNGNPVIMPEMNVTWAIINASNLGNLTENEKLLIQAWLGTTVFKMNGTDPQSTIIPVTYEKQVDISQIMGIENGTSNTNFRVYGCSDNQCLVPSRYSTISEPAFYAVVRKKVNSLRDSIISRTAPNLNDLATLNNVTSIPIYKIISTTTSSRFAFANEAILDLYSQAIAADLASYYLDNIADTLERQAKTITENSMAKRKVDAIAPTLAYVRTQQAKLATMRSEVFSRISQQAAMINQIEAYQRGLDASMTVSLAQNMRFTR